MVFVVLLTILTQIRLVSSPAITLIDTISYITFW